MNTATSFNTKSWPLLLALLASGTLAAQGCGGDDNNPQPSNPVVTGGASGSGGSAGRGGGKGKAGSTSSGGSQNEGGTGAVGEGGTGDTGAGGSGARAGSSNGTGGSSGRSGTGGTGATSGTTGEGGDGNEGNEGGSGNEAGQIDCEVRGERNCYRCEPHATDPAPEWPAAVNEQFLNHCDDSLCSPFDNADRIEGWNGTLPSP